MTICTRVQFFSQILKFKKQLWRNSRARKNHEGLDMKIWRINMTLVSSDHGGVWRVTCNMVHVIALCNWPADMAVWTKCSPRKKQRKKQNKKNNTTVEDEKLERYSLLFLKNSYSTLLFSFFCYSECHSLFGVYHYCTYMKNDYICIT